MEIREYSKIMIDNQIEQFDKALEMNLKDTAIFGPEYLFAHVYYIIYSFLQLYC